MKANSRLTDLRKSFKLTQGELADIIGVDQSTIAHYEAGTREPGKINKMRIAKYFNVTVEYLFYESYYDQTS